MLLLGEISCKANVDYVSVVREAVRDIGYHSSDVGFDYRTCNVLMAIEKQAYEIADSVHVGKKDEDIGAGDQVRGCGLLMCLFVYFLNKKFVM